MLEDLFAQLQHDPKIDARVNAVIAGLLPTLPSEDAGLFPQNAQALRSQANLLGIADRGDELSLQLVEKLYKEQGLRFGKALMDEKIFELDRALLNGFTEPVLIHR